MLTKHLKIKKVENRKIYIMKRYFLTLIVLITFYTKLAPSTPDFTLVDEIVARVYGQEGCHIITRSDLQRPGFGGQPRSLSELIFEAMVYLDALKHKIIIDDEAVDKYIQMIQRENNVTLEQVEQSFKDVGYTVEEGRKQLAILQTVSTMINLRVHKNLVVPRKEVERYYKAYPEYVPEEYTLEYAFFEKDGSEEQKDQLEKALSIPEAHKKIEWTKPFTIKENDIAEEKVSLKSLPLGSISQVFEREDGYETYHLIAKQEKREKSLDERYHQIVEILRRPKMKELQEEYRKKLEMVSSVVIEDKYR